MKNLQNRAKAEWTNGLTRKTANALVYAGYRSKEEMLKLPTREFSHHLGIGSSALSEISEWLGRGELPKRGAAVLLRQIEAVEAAGFKVVRMIPEAETP